MCRYMHVLGEFNTKPFHLQRVYIIMSYIYTNQIILSKYRTCGNPEHECVSSNLLLHHTCVNQKKNTIKNETRHANVVRMIFRIPRSRTSPSSAK